MNKNITKTRNMMAVLLCSIIVLTIETTCPVVASAAVVGGATSEAEARRAMEQAFQQLRAGEYESLYDALPSASQRRISRERFAGALKRARGMYELDKLEVSAVRVAGDLAVVDTVIYGRVRQPIEGEGKIVARQYMVREDRRWRVTTSDRSTTQPLLAANTNFARRFPPREPRIFLKRDGRWVDMSSLAAMRGHGSRAKP